MPSRKDTTKKAETPTRRRTVTRRKKAPVITEEMIATRAYYLHLEEGGDAFENWVRAERELVAV
jgi:hypothetical protein